MKSASLTTALAVLLLLTPTIQAAPPNVKGVEFFEKKIRPVLIEHCYSCHSAAAVKNKKLKGGLLLDTRQGLHKGGDSGSPIIPGKPQDSLLIQALKHDGLKMPPKGKLSEAIISDFVAWVQMGAPDPRDDAGFTAKRTIDMEAGKKYWAFRPLGIASPPSVRQVSKARTPIDRFILARLEEKGLTLNPTLGREKLIRRLSFDLTGLPPTPEEIDAFLNDVSANAYEKLVDRLLGSERYGERWARHWLDVVRFAESGGYEFDKDRPGAHHYRDFVIKALNEDLPFDEFVRLQLAGDRMKPGDIPSTAATGFLVAGPFPGQTTAKTIEPIRYDHLDDMISTVGSSMLGLTIGCARCHEHKYDPIPQQDYYHLIACLSRTDSVEAKFTLNAAAYEKAKADHDKAGAPLLAARDRFEKEVLPKRLQAWIQAVRMGPPQQRDVELRALLKKPQEKRTPKERADIVRLYRLIDADANRVYLAVEDHAKKAPKPNQMTVFAATSGRGGDVHYLIRGETDRKNGVAHPGFIQVLSSTAPQHWLPTTTDPRIGLANWITDAKGGAGHLLARVMVNRVWQHHLGKGLVRTPNDFGMQGEPPTHPELLDWLASELIQGGWKLKRLHRLIVTSAVYQQTGDASEIATKTDPQNHLWGRVAPRRLEAESIRDAVLAVNGTLDTTMYGPGTLDGNGARRSIYLTVKRSQLVLMLQTFDAPEGIQSVGERQTTTGAAQALAMMNSPFVRQRAEKLAQRIAPKSPAELPQAIEQGYRIVLSRRPSFAERERMVRFVNGQGTLADFCQVLLCLNEFVYID